MCILFNHPPPHVIVIPFKVWKFGFLLPTCYWVTLLGPMELPCLFRKTKTLNNWSSLHCLSSTLWSLLVNCIIIFTDQLYHDNDAQQITIRILAAYNNKHLFNLQIWGQWGLAGLGWVLAGWHGSAACFPHLLPEMSMLTQSKFFSNSRDAREQSQECRHISSLC